MENNKVLVTGGAGYIGSHLVNELITDGFEVTVLDNLSTGKKENLNPKAKFVEGDLANQELLKKVFAEGGFGGVFHMAASLEVEESVRKPKEYFVNNVENSIKLLDAMAEAGCNKIIFSSSAAVYGETDNEPIKEDFKTKPVNPYGANKLLIENILEYYSSYLGVQAIIFRYFNACGSASGTKITSKHTTHLVHNVLEVARGAKPSLKVFGEDYPTPDKTCVRDYVHVLDIAKPHILAYKKSAELNKFEIINIGTRKGSSVKEVIDVAKKTLNLDIPVEMCPRRAGDSAVLVADNTKLKNLLGYSPSHSSMENIIKTAWEAL